MIKIENVVLANPDQMKFVINGIRKTMNLSEQSDSETWIDALNNGRYSTSTETAVDKNISMFKMGPKDYSLLQSLSEEGVYYHKFMQLIPVHLYITAPLYWWKEFNVYCSGKYSDVITQGLSAKEFTLEDFSIEYLMDGMFVQKEDEWVDPYENPWFGSKDVLQLIIKLLNHHREKYLETKDEKYFWQIVKLLPSNYNQQQIIMLDYDILAHIYNSCHNIKTNEWLTFCYWIEHLPYSELIIGKEKK